MAIIFKEQLINEKTVVSAIEALGLPIEKITILALKPGEKPTERDLEKILNKKTDENLILFLEGTGAALLTHVDQIWTTISKYKRSLYVWNNSEIISIFSYTDSHSEKVKKGVEKAIAKGTKFGARIGEKRAHGSRKKYADLDPVITKRILTLRDEGRTLKEIRSELLGSGIVFSEGKILRIISRSRP